jgi:hypothetical protein
MIKRLNGSLLQHFAIPQHIKSAPAPVKKSHRPENCLFQIPLSSLPKLTYMSINWPGNQHWTPGEKIAFRFFFIYFLIYTAPWTWIDFTPGLSAITQYYYDAISWLVHQSNKYVFRQFSELVAPNGSGDTSYNWTEVCFYLSLSFAGCVVWSIADVKRANYNRLAYWLRIFVRYTLIIHCFGYGIIKIFSLQMLFPSLSQLATPLGDYLPMRLSWMYMGYSTTYQAFSGVMETMAGILLLFRRTSTFGTLLAAGIFANVMMMNISYDIPVKLFSTHLFAMCLFLLAFEYKRVSDFLLLNRTAAAGYIYRVSFPKKWMRISRIALKCLFVLAVVFIPFRNTVRNYRQTHSQREIKPIRPGVYNVHVFALNGDSLPLSFTDTLRWKDVIFEKGGSGSVNTSDTMFRQRYRRGYFLYSTDTATNEIVFRKNNVMGQSFDLFRLKYEFPDSNVIRLSGIVRGDTLYAELHRTNRHFQLAERQFHWRSEYNR